MRARHVVLEVRHVGCAVVPVDRHEVDLAACAEREEARQPGEAGAAICYDRRAEEEGVRVGHHVLFVGGDCGGW